MSNSQGGRIELCPYFSWFSWLSFSSVNNKSYMSIIWSGILLIQIHNILDLRIENPLVKIEFLMLKFW